MAAQEQHVPPVLVYASGDVMTPDVMTEEHQVKQILDWTGFTTDDQKNVVYSDSISTYSDLNGLKGDDIDSMSWSYGSRNAQDGGIHFGIRRIKRLKALVHWAQDFRRVAEDPTVISMCEAKFLEALDIASERARIRKQHRDDSDVLSKEASPGPLKFERNWVDWEPKFLNYCSVIPGVDGVLLSYVTRLNVDPPPADTEYASFFIKLYLVHCWKVVSSMLISRLSTKYYPSSRWVNRQEIG